MKCLGDGTWNEQEGYEMLKDLKRVHKLKVKKVPKSPEHKTKLLGPADLPVQVREAFYSKEEAIPNKTWTVPPTATTGQLRKRRTSSDSHGASSGSEDQMAMLMNGFLQSMMSWRNDDRESAPGTLSNLQIYANKRQKAVAPSLHAGAPPALEVPPAETQDSQAAETPPGAMVPVMAPAPVSQEAVQQALADRAKSDGSAKAKAKGKAKAKAKAKAAPTPKATCKAAPKATPKAAPKSRIVHQTDPGCPPANSGTWWYKDGKIQASSEDAFRVFLKTTDRCDRT